MTSLKIQGNVLASNINYNTGSSLVSKTLKLKILDCNNLSILGQPQFSSPLTKTLKISGALVDKNPKPESLYWDSYISKPSPWNNLDFYATGLNNNGNVVGSIYNSTGTIILYIVYYTSFNGTEFVIRNFSGGYSAQRINSINDTGNMVGSSLNTTSRNRVPVYWHSYTEEPILVPLGVYTQAACTSINNNGNIVGLAVSSSEPLYWSSNISSPVTFPNASFSSSRPQINNNGNIIINLEDGLNNPVPTYFTSYTGSPININTGSFTNCFALAINDNGNIIGSSYVDEEIQIPLYWSSYASTPIVISTGSFFNYNPVRFNPLCINNSGTIT
jgi:uncharacterized membrane protein